MSKTIEINTIIKSYYNHEGYNSAEEEVKQHYFLRGLIGLITRYITDLTTPEDVGKKVIEICGIENNDKEKLYILDRASSIWDDRQNSRIFEGYQTLKGFMEDKDLKQLLSLLEIDIIENDNIKNLIEDANQNDNQGNSQTPDFLIENSVRLLKPLYHDELNRNDIALYYSGACVQKDHDKSIPLAVLKWLCEDTNDKNQHDRMDTIERTYEKAIKEGKKNVKGLKGLEGVFIGGESNTNFKYLKSILSVKTNGEEEEEEELSDFDKILELTEKNLLYFKDQFGNPYVHINNINIRLSTKSSKIRDYILDICWHSEYNFSPPIEIVNKIIYHFESQATRHGKTNLLELRCAADPEDENIWYYDMGDSTGRSIRISAEDWEIIDNTPIIFRRYMDVETEQVEPNRNYTNDIFDKMLESCFYITNQEIKHLLKVYIIDLFIPNTQKPFQMVYGVQDAGKSFKQELIKTIVDPNPILTHHLVDDLKDLVRILSHNYVVYFDNVSGIPPEVADLFCRGVTGAGLSDRWLYTDEDDRLTRFKRAIGCNGINLGSDRGDLVSRTINTNYEGIKDDQRKDPKEIWKEFESLKPYLLGYIFDILVQVLRKKQEGVTTKVTKFNRMIEFQKDGELISMSMGYEDGQLSKIYDNLVNSQNTDIVENSPTAKAVVYLSEIGTFKNRRGIRRDSATDLLYLIKDHITQTQKLDVNKLDDVPKKPNKLSNTINRLKPALEKLGVIVNNDPNNKDSNGRYIEIRNLNIIGLEEEQGINKIMGQNIDDKDDNMDDKI